MRTLILLRHAKSDYPIGVSDVQRPLSPRGQRDAGAAGIWLRAAIPMIDEVIVSPARRAQETWTLVAEHIQAAHVRTDARIYTDWGERLGDVVSALDPRALTAMIVGHNPGIEDFALSLCREGAVSACERIRSKYPTAGITWVTMRADWSDHSAADVAVFAVPRGAG